MAALATVWVELDGLWPVLFKEKHGGVRGEGFKTWLRTLSGLTADQIVRGLERVRVSGRQYPPGPVEYRAMCFRTPQELGLPTARAAFVMLARRDWTHPIVWVAGQEGAKRGCSAWDVNNRPERDVWPVFEELYRELLERADRGETFEIRRNAVPAISHDPVPQAWGYRSAEEARQEMLSKFGSRRAG